MPFSSSMCGSTNDSQASKKKHDNLSTTSSYVSSKQSKEERFTDAASKSNSGTRDGAEDVSSKYPTTLFALVSKRNWAGAARRCSGAGKAEATNWIVKRNNDGSIRWRLLPIHQACENKAPSQVIKMLIAAYPESLMMMDSFGFLPLHLACRERGSKAVIAALLSKEPAAAKIEDAEGRLPLHLACRQGVAVQIVDSLIACHYRAARTPDAYSLIPLHYACAQNSSLAIIESLLRAHPDSYDLKDKWGRTPLSLAQASTNPEQDEIIKALLKEPTFRTSDEIDNSRANEIVTLKVETTSLVSEIDTLKHKLDETAVEKGEVSSQVKELQVETTSLVNELVNEIDTLKHKLDETAAEKGYFRCLVNELQGENANLRDLIMSLKDKVHLAAMSNMNIFSGEKLDDENSTLVVAEVVGVTF